LFIVTYNRKNTVTNLRATSDYAHVHVSQMRIVLLLNISVVLWKRGLSHKPSVFRRRRNNFRRPCSNILRFIFHDVTQWK